MERSSLHQRDRGQELKWTGKSSRGRNKPILDEEWEPYMPDLHDSWVIEKRSIEEIVEILNYSGLRVR